MVDSPSVLRISRSVTLHPMVEGSILAIDGSEPVVVDPTSECILVTCMRPTDRVELLSVLGDDLGLDEPVLDARVDELLAIGALHESPPSAGSA